MADSTVERGRKGRRLQACAHRALDTASEQRTEERRLMLRYHRCGDLRAREALVSRFLPLARQLARRYGHLGEPQEDLYQVAYVGLLKAIDRYDPDRGAAFTSFAVPTIAGELKRHFRDTAWSLRVPRALQERVTAVSRAVASLSSRHGRSPSPRDVAEATGLSVEEVLEAREAAPAYRATALDAPVPGWEEGEVPTYLDTIGDVDGRYELVELGHAIAPALRALPRKERRALELRFGQDLTQREIAKRIGVSQMHVSRLLRRALERLREAAGGEAA